MKPEEQNQAIAEACGWHPSPYNVQSWTQHPSGLVGPWIYELPNYCASLDAIAEAYNFIRKDRATYWQLHKKLDGIVAVSNSQEGNESLATADATAAQRAEAFLKTLNLWKE